MNLTKNTTKTNFLSATATTVFLTGSFRNVSRTGSSEYQLHLMKVSDRDRNVNKKLVLVAFL